METITLTNAPAVLKNEAMYENVVNRQTIMATDNGSVNILALKRHQQLSRHLAPANAMVQVLEGRVEFTVNDDHYALDAGQFILMDKGTPHEVFAVADSKLLLTLLR